MAPRVLQASEKSMEGQRFWIARRQRKQKHLASQ